MAIAAGQDSTDQTASVLDVGGATQEKPEAEVVGSAVGVGDTNPMTSVTDLTDLGFTLPGFNTPDAPIKLSGASHTSSTLNIADGPGGWRSKVVALARSFLGTPYVWGGENPGGFDCSGLVQYIFGKIGVNLPRLSYDQAAKGKVISFKDAKPGDLIAYHNGPGGQSDHIAIYIGNGMIIEAPRPGRSVQIGRIHDTPGAYAVRIRN